MQLVVIEARENTWAGSAYAHNERPEPPDAQGVKIPVLQHKLSVIHSPHNNFNG